jgi:exonuclease SbcD
MKEKVRIAQMSDLHFSAGNLAESDRCFGHAVTQAIEKNVTAAVITGDSTDHAMDAHSPAIRALASHIQRLADHCPVLLLQGTFSHEPPGLLKVFSLVGAKYPITIAEKIGTFGLIPGEAFEPINPEREYALVVHALPTMNKADVAALTAKGVGEASIHAGEIVSSVLQSWAPVNNQLRLKGVPSMVISHGTVLNCLSEHGVPMAGVDHEFGVGSLFAANADAVALGHIHKQQDWKQSVHGFSQVIAYAGSIGRFHHGEDGDKYWLEWCMQAGLTDYVAHVTPSRRTVDLFFDGPPDMDEIRRVASECEGAYVRVRYALDEEHRQSVDREAIKAALGGAAGVQIESKILVIERSRSKGISTTASLAEKMAKWCEATETSVAPMQERLSLLMNEGIESIVKNAVADQPEKPEIADFEDSVAHTIELLA